MPIAIREDMLTGVSPLEKLTQARSLGLDGVEFNMRDDTDWIKALAEAVAKTGIRVSALCTGPTRLLHPDFAERDAAVAAIRRAMGAAIDTGAAGVVILPYYQQGPVLPDLHPYKSAQELEAELLITQFRATLCDLAYAMGTTLLLQPVNQAESHLIRQVPHAAYVRRKLDNHLHLLVAANLYHMLQEGETIDAVMREHGSDIGYLYLSDSDRRLPLLGDPQLAQVIDTLKESGYDGWICLEHGAPGHCDYVEAGQLLPPLVGQMRAQGIA